jgi:hypothetical protein
MDTSDLEQHYRYLAERALVDFEGWGESLTKCVEAFAHLSMSFDGIQAACREMNHKECRSSDHGTCQCPCHAYVGQDDA